MKIKNALCQLINIARAMGLPELREVSIGLEAFDALVVDLGYAPHHYDKVQICTANGVLTVRP